MKKLILTLIFTIWFHSFSYDFPLKDPYIATVLGSSTLMTEGIMEKIPLKLYYTKFIETRDIPKNLEHQKDYKFTMALQNKKAPLVFVMGGTGSTATSLKIQNFQKILYTAGYHVVGISSAVNTNSIVSLSFDKMPGDLMNDGMNLYRALKKIKTFVETKEEVSSYNLVGYSLGGTHSGVISFIDSKENTFNFNKIFMINPAVNLYDSANLLDNMLDEATDNNIDNAFIRINELVEKAASVNSSGAEEFYSNPTSFLKKLDITRNDLSMGIGLLFRLSAIDVNFISDYANARGVYTKSQITSYENMGKYFKNINFADFNDYLTRIAYPYYKENLNKNLSFRDFTEFSDLNIINDHLKSNKNIFVTTNEDELILTRENLNYLKSTFGDRLKLYPYGGHCGNMYYKDNVSHMLNVLKGRGYYE